MFAVYGAEYIVGWRGEGQGGGGREGRQGGGGRGMGELCGRAINRGREQTPLPRGESHKYIAKMILHTQRYTLDDPSYGKKQNSIYKVCK